MPSPRGSRAFVPFALALGLTVGACWEEDCTSSSQFYCDGKVAKNCSAEHRYYYEKDCGAEGLECAEGRTEAFCALSSEPDERCVTPTSGWCLEDGTEVNCKDGFATLPFSRPCEFCIEVDGKSLCPVTNTPDPRCPDSPELRSVCWENTILSCHHGYLLSSEACSEDRECRDGGSCFLKNSMPSETSSLSEDWSTP